MNEKATVDEGLQDLTKFEHELEESRLRISELRRELEGERTLWQRSLLQAVDKERHRANQAIQTLVEKERHRANGAIVREVERLRQQVQQGFVDRSEKRFQAFSRRLTLDDERLFLEVWAERLGLEVTLPQIRYFEHRLNHVEDVCLGRLAAAIQDAVLRVVVGLARPTDEVRLLEIGTLFGIGSLGLWDLWSGFFRSVHLTLIDPLEGYYSRGTRDLVTGLPVSLEILQRNMRLLGVSEESVTLLRGLSEDPAILERAREARYDVILVDGDHSYEGVARDFQAYGDLAVEGGFLIFDDYGHPGWPGVKEAVDQFVTPCPHFEWVGVGWHTAVFRRVHSSGRH